MIELNFKKFSGNTLNNALNFILYSKKQIYKVDKSGKTINIIKIFISDNLTTLQ